MTRLRKRRIQELLDSPLSWEWDNPPNELEGIEDGAYRGDVSGHAILDIPGDMYLSQIIDQYDDLIDDEYDRETDKEVDFQIDSEEEFQRLFGIEVEGLMEREWGTIGSLEIDAATISVNIDFMYAGEAPQRAMLAHVWFSTQFFSGDLDGRLRMVWDTTHPITFPRAQAGPVFSTVIDIVRTALEEIEERNWSLPHMLLFTGKGEGRIKLYQTLLNRIARDQPTYNMSISGEKRALLNTLTVVEREFKEEGEPLGAARTRNLWELTHAYVGDDEDSAGFGLLATDLLLS